MSPRERYEAADALLAVYELCGSPRLLALAEHHVAVAETHLATCPNAALEVSGV
ncbi:hypothetical protein KGD82_16800 [Nocardiopsis eucommiae]|uniref:Uncharacterized protein n=1 Tax=Nocardiopsis eucommiae TaxID=2831970 RepID=A0A975L889_9ACTN|nr:hypothetical protein KGD82_16800 [Nocardiopsis eucommiae]